MRLWVGDDWEGFQDKWKELSAHGLRLIDLETYNGGGVRRYAGVFREGNGKHALWVGDDWEGFEEKWKELSADGLRLIDIETWVQDGTTALRRASSGRATAHALWVGDDWDGFEAEVEGAVRGRPAADRFRDLARWPGAPVCRRLRGRQRQARAVGERRLVRFKGKWQELSGKGLRLTKIEVYGPSLS